MTTLETLFLTVKNTSIARLSIIIAHSWLKLAIRQDLLRFKISDIETLQYLTIRCTWQTSRLDIQFATLPQTAWICRHKNTNQRDSRTK